MSSQHATDSNETNLAEEGPIATLFSGPARTRIIEAFVANSKRELNVSDIARLSDTARSTVYRHIEELEKLEIIKPVGDGAKRYTFNREDEIAEFLHKLEGVTLKRLLERGE